MNTIEQLRDVVMAVLPSVQADLDSPKNPHGRWFLDLVLDNHRVVVEWSPRRGFGVSASDRAGLGEGPEEVYNDVAAAVERVLHLFRTKESTRLPRAVRLRELRAEVAHVTQETLAERLGIQQAAVSKLERRTDTTVGTLQRIVRALGGELELVAKFPDEAVVISQFDESPEKAAACLHTA